MAETDENFHAGHRDRLRKKFLKDQLTDYEQLELALVNVIQRRDVRKIARALMERFGSIYQILTASYEDLLAVPGMGPSSAIALMNIRKIMLAGFQGFLSTNAIYYDYEQFLNYCRLNVGCKKVEEVHVLYLDSQHFLLADDVHSVGTVNESIVYPREIVKRALALEAHSVALVHNHPTPNISFSDTDIKMTAELMTLLNAINISLYDHFVVAGSTIYSARNMHLLD